MNKIEFNLTTLLNELQLFQTLTLGKGNEVVRFVVKIRSKNLTKCPEIGVFGGLREKRLVSSRERLCNKIFLKLYSYASKVFQKMKD